MMKYRSTRNLSLFDQSQYCSLLCGAEQALRYQDLQTQSQTQNSCLSAAE
jgi:hypothetical protein